ncbi:hypothetical protein TEA_018478 [Camellia sinensis var. sinensis]|uniref:Uncharacterized protein n=1 Tax=Camellia sinensis var. sinensis TaxID=542762 RepID=A0A4S4EMM9_CAMSN|nr:hypothetical protein TEA_018478 [Camellia sinensis var. sinensis]
MKSSPQRFHSVSVHARVPISSQSLVANASKGDCVHIFVVTVFVISVSESSTTANEDCLRIAAAPSKTRGNFPLPRAGKRAPLKLTAKGQKALTSFTQRGIKLSARHEREWGEIFHSLIWTDLTTSKLPSRASSTDASCRFATHPVAAQPLYGRNLLLRTRVCKFRDCIPDVPFQVLPMLQSMTVPLPQAQDQVYFKPKWRSKVLSLSTIPCQRHLGCVRNEFLGDQLRRWKLEFEWLMPRTQRFGISETKVWFKYPEACPRLELYPSLVTSKVLQTPFQTFVTWKSSSQGPFIFNTRVFSPDPCDRPVIFFLDQAEMVKMSETLTTYKKVLAEPGLGCFRTEYVNATLVQLVNVSAAPFQSNTWKKVRNLRQEGNVVKSSMVAQMGPTVSYKSEYEVAIVGNR